MKDVMGIELYVGAFVGCAFSYPTSSVGHIRVGRIESMEDENSIRIYWRENETLSPKLKYGNSSRWVIL